MLRNAKKSVEGSGSRELDLLAPPAPEATFSPEETAGAPCAGSGRAGCGCAVACALPWQKIGAENSALAPSAPPPERVRLGGGARGRERRESSRLRNGRRLRGLLRARNKSSEPRLNLSGSWQQGHSAAYNTPFLIQVVCKGFVGPGP